MFYYIDIIYIFNVTKGTYSRNLCNIGPHYPFLTHTSIFTKTSKTHIPPSPLSPPKICTTPYSTFGRAILPSSLCYHILHFGFASFTLQNVYKLNSDDPYCKPGSILKINDRNYPKRQSAFVSSQKEY